MALDWLFGGGGGGDPQITQIPAPAANLPNQNELNSIAQARTFAGSPWTYGPYRAIDYFRNAQVTQNMLPQFGGAMAGSMGGAGFLTNPLSQGQFGMLMSQPMQQQMGMMQGQPQGPGLMGDFSNPMAAMQQPQFSPLAWAMQLGELYNQLGGMYQNQMMGQGQQPQPQQGQPQQQQQQQPAQQQQPTP